ncbi:MAG TPA: universal stress protein, partial [Rubrobacter sp.]|nr:universal stress protein [Rubrobacter sp.]
MSIFPTKILLATDGSEDAELAASSAVELAKAGTSELHVLYVGPGLPLYELPDYPARFEEVVAAQRQEAQRILDDQVKGVEALGATVVGVHVEMDERPERTIVELGEKLGAGLVVMGSRGLGGLRRTLMGSVSDSVVRHAHCPVIVARWKPVAFPAKILIATDGSEGARLAVTTAADVAERTGSELHVVHVGEVRPVYHPEMRGYLARYEELQQEARRLLEEQVEQVRA